jgi:hypothetical protein
LGIQPIFFKEFRLGALLNRSNITKTRGASHLMIFSLLFNHVFTGKSLFREVVKSKAVTMVFVHVAFATSTMFLAFGSLALLSGLR